MPRRQGYLLLFVSLALTGNLSVRGEFSGREEKPKPAEAKTILRKDLYGDALPKGAVARLGTTYLRTDFHDVAFRADGREFYSWNQDGRLRVYDAATGKVVRVFLLPDPPISGVQFSANGRFLTLGVDRGVGDPSAKALTVWETTTGKLLHRIEPVPGEAFYSWDAALHDSRTLITCDVKSGAVRLWNLKTGASRLLRKTSRGIVRFAGSPDGKRLFVQMHESIQCWDMTVGKKLWEGRGGGQEMLVAPDGKALLFWEMIVGGDRLTLVDPATGKQHPGWKLPPGLHGWPRWGVDGRTLLIPHHDDKFIRIWDFVAGKERGRLPWESGAIAMAQDGKSLLGEDRGLQRWDLRTMKPLYPSTAERGHLQAVADLAYSPDGKSLVSAGGDGTLRFWDLRTSRVVRVVRDTGCVSLAFTSDGGRLIVGTRDDTLLICDPTSGKILDRRKLENLPPEFRGLERMTLCEGKKLILNVHRYALSVRAWSSGPGSVTAAWDLKTGKRLWLRSVEGIKGLSGLSPDGRLALDWDLKLRETESGRLLGRLAEKDNQGPAANHGTVFSPDSSLLVTASSRLPNAERFSDWKDSGTQIWERATCRLLRRLPVSAWLHSAAFAPDGRRLALLRGKELWVWDVVRGKELLYRRAPGNAAYWRGTRLAFAPNGRSLAMATEDGGILLWEVPAAAPGVRGDALVRRAWEALGDSDPAKAFVAAADLADQPSQAVALLTERLRPVATIPAEQVRRLVAALDDDSFEARGAAERKLAALGSRVWPALRKALGQHPSLEARRRLERILENEKRPPPNDMLRTCRALRALVWADTSQARDLLRKLASGDPDAPLTQEAKAALRRLERMPRE